MTRISKQEERRMQYPKKRKPMISKKTGKKKDNLEKDYREHVNAFIGECAFIPKVK